jgi:CRP/FNR family transcriptional regulator
MEQLFEGMPTRQYRKGQILIYEGDPVEYIYLLESGYVKVSNLVSNEIQRTIIIYTPGEAFPLTSFLSGEGVARYFYECMTDVKLRSKPQADFQKMIKGNLELGEELIAYTYKMSQQFVERIETLSATSSKLKIVSLLNYLAKKTGKQSKGQIKINIPLTTQEIADMCGLTRETTNLQLIKLRKEGVVIGRQILTLDKDKLKKLTIR